MENGKFKIGDVCILVSRPEVDTCDGVEVGQKVRVVQFMDPEEWYNVIGITPVGMAIPEEEKKLIEAEYGVSGEAYAFCNEDNLELVE